MPISKFQSDVLRLLAAQLSPDSYVAGGIAINRKGPRFSAHIDIFHDSADRLESAVKADEAALTAAGYTVTWASMQRTGKREVSIEKAGGQIALEWLTDSAFRFFPTQPDALFGYVLHPVDLAANKASAAADRRVPRDVVDLVTIHEDILLLGAVVAAAVGKFPGTTPEECWPRLRGTAVSRRKNFRFWQPSSRLMCRVCIADPPHDRGRRELHYHAAERRCGLRFHGRRQGGAAGRVRSGQVTAQPWRTVRVLAVLAGHHARYARTA